MFGCLKHICLMDDNDVISPISFRGIKMNADVPNMELINRLLQSESRDCITPISEDMETLLLYQDSLDHRYSNEHMEDDPEAMLDVLTMKTLRERYSDVKTPAHCRKGHNEAEFEHYVKEFPIDDTIAECFAFAPENTKRKTNFLQGGKRPQFPKYQRMKKKFGWEDIDDDILISDEEVKSRDTKRTKTTEGHERRPREKSSSRKSVNFSDQSEPYMNGVAYKGFLSNETGPFGQQTTYYNDTSLTSRNYVSKPVILVDLNTTDSFSSQSMGHYSSQLNKKHKFPPLEQTCGPGPGNVHAVSLKSDTSDSASVGEDCFKAILVKDKMQLEKNLDLLAPGVAGELRDGNSNTLLHRSVLDGNKEAVELVSERYPGMSSDLNSDRMTPVELAAKMGQENCLKPLLDRALKPKAVGSPLVNRLLNICAANGQCSCLSLVLGYLPGETGHTCILPGDGRGNTAAHIAARNGHLNCLKVLVVNGYDVSSENGHGQKPLHVAEQNGKDECQEYLITLDVCEKILQSCRKQSRALSRMNNQFNSTRTSIDQLKGYLQRYQKLFSETRLSLGENKDSLLQTLNTIYSDMEGMVSGSNSEGVSIDRDKLEELKAEIERLEDTFEFSPLADLDNAFSRLTSALHETVTSCDVKQHEQEGQENSQEVQASALLCQILQQVHAEGSSDSADTLRIVEDHIAKLSVSRESKPEIDCTKPVTSCGHGTAKQIQTQSNVQGNTNPYSNLNGENISPTDTKLQSERGDSKVKVAPVHIQQRPGMCDEVRQKHGFSGAMLRKDAFLRQKDVHSGLETESSPEDSNSVLTTTITSVTGTSGITTETSEYTSRVCSSSDEITTNSGSFWWDPSEVRHRTPAYEYDEDSNSSVRLNVENEDAPDEQLRNERLHKHLRSIEQATNPSIEFIETITTASGEVIGGLPFSHRHSDRVTVNVNEALLAKQGKKSQASSEFFKPKKKSKVKLFKTSSAREMTESKFLESYDRSGDPDSSGNIRWDDMNYSDTEDVRPERAWYELSEDEESFIHSWRSVDTADETDDIRTPKKV